MKTFEEVYKLIDALTDVGIDDGAYLLLDENNIRIIYSEELIDLRKQTENNIIIIEGSGKSPSTIRVIKHQDDKAITQ